MSIQTQLAQIAQLNAGCPRKHVTILGAGMAGLVAAYELRALGHTVRVYEGSSRVGGRVWTHRFEDGTYGELGAMRIPCHHDFTRHYVTKLGLSLRQFVSAHQNPEAFYDIGGCQLRIKDAPRLLYPQFPLSPEQEAAPKAPDMLNRVLIDVIEGLTQDERAALLNQDLVSERLRKLDRTSLGDFLLQRAGAGARELIGLATGLESFFGCAMTMFLRDALQSEGERLDEIVGGMDLLPRGLAAAIAPAIEFDTEVCGIHRATDGTGKVDVAVRRRGGTSVTREPCDYVICTLPFTVLRRLDISPQFSPGKMRAIGTMHYASSTKVLLHCSARFWETRYGIYGGASQSDQLIRAVYYPSDNASVGVPVAPAAPYSTLYSGLPALTPGPLAPPEGRPGVLLGSYTWEDDARRLGALPEPERIAAVKQGIARFHREITNPGVVDDHASMFWDSYRGMGGGTFSFLAPGQHADLFADAIAPEGNVFFAGEHCSLDNAWIQGALVSALRAVEGVVQA